MRISVFGSGYVGLVSGTCFSELGNHVTCYDPDEAKIAKLKQGQLPIYEPGLEDIVLSNVAADRLTFTTDVASAVKTAEIIFLAVGTPSSEDGSANLKYIFQAAKDIAKYLDHDVIVATKSTVPVGTADQLKRLLAKTKHRVTVASNPEFLREGAAIKDFMNPDRIVVGIDDEAALPIFQELYRGVARLERPLVFMSVKSAELTKYAANAFLATKISFVNEIAHLAERIGADISEVTNGMGLDSRIGSRFLHAGVGFGGSCFPKDVRALQSMFRSSKIASELLEAVEKINHRQKQLPIKKLTGHLKSLKNKTIAVWGVSFKPRTDDVREAASLVTIPALIEAGASVKVFDPKGMENARPLLPEKVTFVDSAFEAASKADALIILTEWDEFRTVDLTELNKIMKGNILIDGRNIYTKSHAQKAGFRYEGIGSGLASPEAPSYLLNNLEAPANSKRKRKS